MDAETIRRNRGGFYLQKRDLVMRSVAMIVLSLFVLSAFVHTPEKSEAVHVAKPKVITGSSMPVMNSEKDLNTFPTVQDTSAPLFDSLFNVGPKAPAVCGPGMDCGQGSSGPVRSVIRGRSVQRGQLFNGRVRGFFRFGCRGC